MAGYRPFPNLEVKNFTQERFEVPALLRLLRLPRGRRMLEIGCGRGIALPPLARLSPSRLVGVDVDAALLAVASLRLEEMGVKAELVQADARALPFPDASFDVVLDFGTVYHISAADSALREIARVLTPRGIFVHETPLAQLAAHPIRSIGRDIPWMAVPELRADRTAGLWAVRVKTPAASAVRSTS